MKHYLAIAFICLSFLGKAQNTGVEKSVYGVQVGLLGIWANNETKLTNTIALRSEIGFDSEIWGGSYNNTTGFVMAPVLTLEPRLYFNLQKRNSKKLKTENNTGNFLSLQTSFHPDWFTISNYDNVSIISDISIIPTWGIRRHFGEHINFETGIGLGYRYLFAKRAGYVDNKSEVALNLHLRFGYTF